MANANAVSYRRVYVWELPVRLYHCINGICALVLIITGYIIGNSTATLYAYKAYQGYLLGIVRFIHFVTSYVFIFSFLVRFYWGFVGNRYARWSNYVPFRNVQWRKTDQILKAVTSQTKYKRLIAITTNALDRIFYFLFFLVFLFQSFTGFVLYSSVSSAFFPSIFAWAVQPMGGYFAVRQWHYRMMWVFVVFIIIHLYLVVYHDLVEGRGTISSIIRGWKLEQQNASE